MKSYVLCLMKKHSQWFTVGFSFIHELQYDTSVLSPYSGYCVIISEIEIAILDTKHN